MQIDEKLMIMMVTRMIMIMAMTNFAVLLPHVAPKCLPLPWISFDAFLTQGLSMQIVAAAMDQVRLLIAHVC